MQALFGENAATFLMYFLDILLSTWVIGVTHNVAKISQPLYLLQASNHQSGEKRKIYAAI